jgi:type IV secretion system protein VirD4
MRGYLFLLLLFSVFAGWKITSSIFNDMEMGDFINGLFHNNTTPGLAFLGITIGVLIILASISLFIAKKVNFLQKQDNNLASSDFAKINEFNGFTGNDGLIIGQQFRLSEKKSFEHVVCVGPTGSGKSVSYFIPNLLSLPNSSVVVSDPKGELFEKTAATSLAQGKKVLVFSPFKENSMKYNPLALCRSISEIRELAQILLANGNAAVESITGTKAGGSEWTNMSTPLLSAFLIFVKDLNPPKNTVTYALNLIIENDLDTLKLLMMDGPEPAQKQFNVFLQSAESEKTASSIKTVLASNLQMFLDPKELRKQPTVLHIVVPEHKSATMAPLMAPFYTQLLGHLIEDGKGCPVHFLLDEFANIGLIPNIDVIAATCRSRSMSLSLGIQSINQLKQRYNDAAVSLLDNLKTKFFLPGLAYESAEYASKLVGFREIDTTSTSFGKDNISHSVSKQKRELLTPDEVRRLADETALIITDNRNPFIDKQCRYYKNPKMVQATKK